MKLKNTSKKVISVGTTVLMPGDEMTVNEDMVKSPAVTALVNRGTFAIDDSEERIKEAADRAAKEAKAAAEEEAKKKAEDAVAKKKAEEAAAKKKAEEEAKKKAAESK